MAESDAAIRHRADKELSTIATLIPPLNSGDFHVFERALQSAAYRFRWPPWIPDVKDNDDHSDVEDSLKDECETQRFQCNATTLL